MTPNAPQPPVPEPDAACDPHRGEPTQDWGLQHTFHCVRLSSRYRERCLKKPWEGCAGRTGVRPAHPQLQPVDHFDARRAPCVSASSFAHAIDG